VIGDERMEETILSYKDLEVARVPFCYISENYFFSLIYADLKTQIYADIFCDYLRGFISAISARTIFSH